MRSIVLRVPADEAEIAADRLWQAGARAVEERSGGGASVELLTTLGTDDSVSMTRLGATPANWEVRFVEVDDEPAETWREFAQPIVVNDRLVIQPAWIEAPSEPGVLTIPIEPGGAFGLGDHPTTRLSAALVDELVISGTRMLDVGCGSGVLSVLAALRGAGRVTAIDISEPAREATVANADRNGVGDLVDASTTPIEHIDARFDLVVANILAPTLVGMATSLREAVAPQGRLIVSGVLAGHSAHVVDALAPMRTVAERHLDGWSAVVLAADEC